MHSPSAVLWRFYSSAAMAASLGWKRSAFFSWLNNPFVQAVVFLAKAMFGYWVIMWIKYSMPRIRIDHMLAFNWKFLTPLALVVLVNTAILSKVLGGLPSLGLYPGNVLLECRDWLYHG